MWTFLSFACKSSWSVSGSILQAEGLHPLGLPRSWGTFKHLASPAPKPLSSLTPAIHILGRINRTLQKSIERRFARSCSETAGDVLLHQEWTKGSFSLHCEAPRCHVLNLGTQRGVLWAWLLLLYLSSCKKSSNGHKEGSPP